MAEYRTGQTAPATGTYRSVRHAENTSCHPTVDERSIPLSMGDTFPPCRSCNGAIWND